MLPGRVSVERADRTQAAWSRGDHRSACAVLRPACHPGNLQRWCVLKKRTDEPPKGARRTFHVAPFQRVKVPSG